MNPSRKNCLIEEENDRQNSTRRIGRASCPQKKQADAQGEKENERDRKSVIRAIRVVKTGVAEKTEILSLITEAAQYSWGSKEIKRRRQKNGG